MRWKSKVTAARALSARSAAPSSPHPQEMEKLEAVEKQGCAGWIFTWLELGVDSNPNRWFHASTANREGISPINL